MTLSIYIRSPFGVAKRLRIDPLRASPFARITPEPNPRIVDSRGDFATYLHNRQAHLQPTLSGLLVNQTHNADGSLLAVSVDDLLARLSQRKTHSLREGF